MLAAVCKFFSDEADAVEVGAHREFLVLGLRLSGAGALLGERLLVERKGEDNVAADFPGVELAVEAAEFNRMVAGEKAVQVQKMIAAVVVVPVAALTVALVPDVLKLSHCLRSAAVHLFHQKGVHLFAVGHAVRFNLQGLVEKVVFAGNDVDEVTNASWGMVATIKVNVDATGGVRKTASLA